MNGVVICVFGAASNKIDEVYKNKCYDLCRALASRGHDLIFGAGGEGMMGAAARGFKDGGAKIHGVIPEFFEENGYEAVFYGADELTRTADMGERKKIMEDGCDAYVVVPGGIGTFDELFEILTLKQLGRENKAIAIYNINGYYDGMNEFLKRCVELGFVNVECENLVGSFEDEASLINYIEGYTGDNVEWNALKKSEK